MDVIDLCYIIDESVCSDMCKVKPFLKRILNMIGEKIHDKNIMFDIRLILDELITNGVLHGNKCDRKKCVSLSIKIDSNKVRIEVSDEGKGFIYDKGAYNPLELKCSGRGLVIVEGLSDEFYVHNNKIISIKYL